MSKHKPSSEDALIPLDEARDLFIEETEFEDWQGFCGDLDFLTAFETGEIAVAATVAHRLRNDTNAKN